MKLLACLIFILAAMNCVTSTPETVWFGKCSLPELACPLNFDGFPTTCLYECCFYVTDGTCSSHPNGVCPEPFTCINQTCYGPAKYGSCDVQKNCPNDFYRCMGSTCVAPTNLGVLRCSSDGNRTSIDHCRVRQCNEGFDCSPMNTCCPVNKQLP